MNLDTLIWTKPKIEGDPPSPRRAHTTCIWNQKIIIVGGGDGVRALANVHTLDVSDPQSLKWYAVRALGNLPIARGYHTSNLVKDKLVVYGGSDGHECFSDVHVLDLGTALFFFFLKIFFFLTYISLLPFPSLKPLESNRFRPCCT